MSPDETSRPMAKEALQSFMKLYSSLTPSQLNANVNAKFTNGMFIDAHTLQILH